MVEDETRDIVRRWFDGIDRGNAGILDEVGADGYRLHFTGASGPLGREAAKGLFTGFFAAFPDVEHTIDDLVVDGERAAARITIRGTQRGEFNGLPPTGRRIDLPAVNVMSIAEGRIAEHWPIFDSLTAPRQLGVEPA